MMFENNTTLQRITKRTAENLCVLFQDAQVRGDINDSAEASMGGV